MIDLNIEECSQIMTALRLMQMHDMLIDINLYSKIANEHSKFMKNSVESQDNLIP